VDLFAVKQPDNKHVAVLSSERSLARSYGRWAGDVIHCGAGA
jgi:hypothetical protein